MPAIPKPTHFFGWETIGHNNAPNTSRLDLFMAPFNGPKKASQNMTHQNMTHQNMTHLNMTHQNMTHQNMGHQNMTHQNMGHQNMDDQSWAEEVMS